MKPTSFFTFLLAFCLFAFTQTASAQTKGTETLVIKTSAVCEMCKAQIERAVAFQKGVQAVNLNIENRELTVTYKPNKSTADDLRKAVAMVGYDADHIPADPKAYEKIDECCKKENNMH